MLLNVAFGIPFAYVQNQRVTLTIETIREIGASVDRHVREYGEIPALRSIRELAILVDVGEHQPLPKRDGWGNELRFVAWSEDSPQAGVTYVVASAGSDGVWEADDPRDYLATGPFGSIEHDIVLKNGAFIRWPGTRIPRHPE
jgi:hypothetical protein